MKIDFKSCTAEELWKYVSLHLERKGFDVVLVGGSVVSIYSEGRYQSNDLDFIVRSMNKKELPKALEEIGFVKTPGRYYKHPECENFYLEFPTGPIEIDGKYVEPEVHTIEGVGVKILSPTDCALDRIEQFLYCEYGKPHGERKLLEQALLVIRKQPVNMKRIEAYLTKEGRSDVFAEIVASTRK